MVNISWQILPKYYHSHWTHVGVSLNGGKTPHFTPQVLIIFSLENPLVVLGTSILGTPHMLNGI